MPVTVQPIIRWPHDRLRSVSKPVIFIDGVNLSLPHLVADLEATLATKKTGVALSAIQIGWGWQVFVVEKCGVKVAGDGVLVFVNPVLRGSSQEQESKEEGCLSLPNVFLQVTRSKKVEVSALDLEGKEFTVETDGLYARVLQHEMDHLAGKTIADSVGTAEREMIRKKLLKRKVLRLR